VADPFVIETADLHKRYGAVEALRGLTLQVPRGAIYGFLGRNGAGKTTTIKVLLGMARPTSFISSRIGWTCGGRNWCCRPIVSRMSPTTAVNSRLRMAEQAFRKAHAAGVPIVFGSGATSAAIPHGIGADQFKHYASWGMTPSQAIRTAFLPAAEMLNYGWSAHIGSLETGKFADVIAVANRGNYLLVEVADKLQD